MYMLRSNISNKYVTLSRGTLSAVICSQGVMFIRILLACKVNMVQLLRPSEVHELEISGDASMFVCLPWAQHFRYVRTACGTIL